MKVREAITLLYTFPLDDEIMDEYGENILAVFYASSYDDESGNHSYVAYETIEKVG
jgi:hypothetical protein